MINLLGLSYHILLEKRVWELANILAVNLKISWKRVQISFTWGKFYN